MTGPKQSHAEWYAVDGTPAGPSRAMVRRRVTEVRQKPRNCPENPASVGEAHCSNAFARCRRAVLSAVRFQNGLFPDGHYLVRTRFTRVPAYSLDYSLKFPSVSVVLWERRRKGNDLQQQFRIELSLFGMTRLIRRGHTDG